MLGVKPAAAWSTLLLDELPSRRYPQPISRTSVLIIRPTSVLTYGNSILTLYIHFELPVITSFLSSVLPSFTG